MRQNFDSPRISSFRWFHELIRGSDNISDSLRVIRLPLRKVRGPTRSRHHSFKTLTQLLRTRFMFLWGLCVLGVLLLTTSFVRRLVVLAGCVVAAWSWKCRKVKLLFYLVFSIFFVFGAFLAFFVLFRGENVRTSFWHWQYSTNIIHQRKYASNPSVKTIFSIQSSQPNWCERLWLANNNSRVTWANSCPRGLAELFPRNVPEEWLRCWCAVAAWCGLWGVPCCASTSASSFPSLSLRESCPFSEDFAFRGALSNFVVLPRGLAILLGRLGFAITLALWHLGFFPWGFMDFFLWHSTFVPRDGEKFLSLRHWFFTRDSITFPWQSRFFLHPWFINHFWLWVFMRNLGLWSHYRQNVNMSICTPRQIAIFHLTQHSSQQQDFLRLFWDFPGSDLSFLELCCCHVFLHNVLHVMQ